MDDISILNIPVSQLERLPKNSHIGEGDLFMVSQPTDGGKVSRSVTYQTLANNVSASLNISGINERIRELSNGIEVAETLSYLSNLTNSRNPIPTVISALAENNRGQIVALSGYILSNALSDILYRVQMPKMDAVESPWVRQSQVKDEFGDSTTDPAS